MLTVLRPRWVPNSTLPGASANSVSSPPRPTRSPGWNLVPRCRTRISPALTNWPPKRLTPSRWACESRPLRELDAPFLCAMVLLLSALDAGDPNLRQLLTAAHSVVVAGLVLELVDLDLRTLDLAEHLTGDGDGRQFGGVGGHLSAVDQ